MKKIFLATIALLLLVSAPTFADTTNPYQDVIVRVNFIFSKIDQGVTTGGTHRTPPRAPEVYIDGNTLIFADSCDGCTLQLLLPESDVVVFSTVIAPGTTTLTLPYEGEYTLRIIRGDYSFTGVIEI